MTDMAATFRCSRCHRVRPEADRWTPSRAVPGRVPPLCWDCRPGTKAKRERARRWASIVAILTNDTLTERTDDAAEEVGR